MDEQSAPDHQTQKLMLTFVGQGGVSRTLDALDIPDIGWWRIGRDPINDITFRLLTTSKFHAEVTVSVNKKATVETGCPVYQWHLIDIGSSNGTYLDMGNNRPYRLAQNVPYLILDKYSVQFGSSAAKVVFDFDIYPTENLPRVKDEGTLQGERRHSERPEDDTPRSPWFVPAILEPAWRWFTGQAVWMQCLILFLCAALVALWIVERP